MHVSYFHIQCVAAVQVCRVAPTGEWGGGGGGNRSSLSQASSMKGPPNSA